MNLELLDPFGRQVPDRVDATLQLPESIVPPIQTSNTTAVTSSSKQSRTTSAAASSIEKHKNEQPTTTDESRPEDEEDWKAAFHVAFNRRGKYVAVGYGSSKLAIYDVASRSIVALYDTAEDYDDDEKEEDTTTGSSPDSTVKDTHKESHPTKKQQQQQQQQRSKQPTQPPHRQRRNYGVSCLSWSRRSRTLLVGASGNPSVRLYDMTHPHGPDTIAAHLVMTTNTTTAAGILSTSLDHPDTDKSTTTTTTPKQKDPPSFTTPSSSTESASSVTVIPPMHSYEQTKRTGFVDSDPATVFVKKCRTLRTFPKQRGEDDTAMEEDRTDHNDHIHTPHEDNNSTIPRMIMRHSCISFQFPHPVGGSLQIHPMGPFGIAVLQNLDLVAFAIPKDCFTTTTTSDLRNDCTQEKADEDSTAQQLAAVHIQTIATNVTCAALDPRGDHIYAASKDDGGIILEFTVNDLWPKLAAAVAMNSTSSNVQEQSQFITLQPLVPSMKIPIKSSSGSTSGTNETTSGGSSASSSAITVWHIIISRNGKFLIANCADGTIRLFNIAECRKKIKNTGSSTEGELQPSPQTNTDPIKPTWIFQDVVTKVKFASCDMSGDGEYVVGGTNFGADHGDKYELYIWNSSTGALMDKLTGASTRLYAVAWHPTRPFLAVACADGITDLWGPRVNWTAFAPDFQALPMNVEYIEREDEFDVDAHGRHLAQGSSADDDLPESLRDGGNIETTTCSVDVTTIEPVPAFASDSEDERDVFTFDLRVKNLVVGKYKDKSNKANTGDD
jgi:hypothetical protein